MKVIVVGCTHAGTAAAINIKTRYKDVELVVYERNDNVSFLSCFIPLNIGGTIDSTNKLFYSSPEKLEALGICAKMKHDVQHIDFEAKKLQVKDLKTGVLFEDTYDKLVLTIGSWPVIPKLQGLEYQNIEICKNYTHARILIEKSESAKKVVIVGAGYIGVELAEAFQKRGKQVTVIQSNDRIMNQYLDKPFTDLAEQALRDHGINLILGERVQSFEGEDGKVTQVITDKNRFEADLVVVCIGFRPNTELIRGKLETLPNGAIIVDDYMRTSQEDVFAGGDCCMVHYNPVGDKRYIPLNSNAVRMGTLIAENLMQPTLRYIGTQGTSAIKIYDYNIASTGLTEEMAQATATTTDQSITQSREEEHQNTLTFSKVGSATVQARNRLVCMPDEGKTMIKIVFDKDSGRILGGQIISKQNVTELMNTLSVVIQNHMTIDELSIMDFFFQPCFNKPWSLLNEVALEARSDSKMQRIIQ